MDEADRGYFLKFWDRVNNAKTEIRDWCRGPLQDYVAEEMDEGWFKLYENMKPSLQPFAKKRPFTVHPVVPGNSVFEAETAHEALMFFLNPPKALFGRKGVLDEPKYLRLECEAQDEFEVILRGLDISQAVLQKAVESQVVNSSLEQSDTVPRWDKNTKTFWCGGIRCKTFKKDAPQQIAILGAFQDAGWPERISDPLLQNQHRTAYKRIRQQTSDALLALNKNTLLIRFVAVDGDQILWEAR